MGGCKKERKGEQDKEERKIQKNDNHKVQTGATISRVINLQF
jgi:hypothetical protein